MPTSLIAPGSQSVYQILFNLAVASFRFGKSGHDPTDTDKIGIHRLVQNTVSRLSKSPQGVEPKPRKLDKLAEVEQQVAAKAETKHLPKSR